MKSIRYVVAAITLIASMNGVAFAKDTLSVDAKAATGPQPVIVNNGQAVGTIQLFYTVNATEFPIGQFATFDLDWAIAAGSKAMNYGSGIDFKLIQSQNGGNVELAPSPDSFLLTGAGQSGTSTVTINITNGKNGLPPSNVDGTDLVGNLKLDAGSDIGTVTSIQVHIRLEHPTNCIKVYNFVTDQDFNIGVLNTTNLNKGNGKNNSDKIVSSQPGQFSDNVLVANVCGAPHSFDAQIALDSSFSTSPVNNPTNAVVAYSAAGEFDPTTFGALLALNSNSYQSLCVQNLTVAPNSSLLLAVHSKIKDDLLVASLPADKTFDFTVSLYQTVNQSCSGPLDALASPNPASFTLPFTVNGN